MKVLVTGSSGFIGSHLVRELASRRLSCVGLDRRPPTEPGVGFDDHRVDLRDRRSTEEVLHRVRPDAVVHLAARTDVSLSASVDEYDDNTRGTENLLEAIRAVGSVQKLVLASTQLVSELGHVPTSLEECRPASAYGASKVISERIAVQLAPRDLNLAIVRPTSIWGPRMNPAYLGFFRLLRRGLYFHVGRRSVEKAYGFIGNTIYQIASILENMEMDRRPAVFYLADYERFLLEDWCEGFRSALQAPRIRRIPLPLAKGMALCGDMMSHAGVARPLLTSHRLRNMLGSNVVPLGNTRELAPVLPYSQVDGIRLTVPWVREALDWPPAASCT